MLIFKIVSRIVTFPENPRNHKNVTKNQFAWGNCRKNPWFSRSERLRSPARCNWWPKLKNRDFWCENRPDRSKSRKLNTFFRHLPSAGRQNRVQNRRFSENPRWGPYKNHKNVTKYRSTPGNCWKTVIFTFWTASITSTRQLVAEAEKSWYWRDNRSDLLSYCTFAKQ